MKKYFFLLIVILMILGFTHTLGEKVVLTLAGSSKYAPIHRVVTDDNKMALTFNVNAYDENIERILKKLKEFEVKSTFFLTEELIKESPELVRKIYLSGHQIGWLAFGENHIDQLTMKYITQKIEEISLQLEQNIGVGLEVLRPEKDYNDTLLVTCKNLKIHCVVWDVNSNDNKEIGINDIVQRVKLGSQKGSIILFNSEGKYTLEAVSILLKDLRDDNIALVSLNNLLYKDKYDITIDGEQVKKR